MNKRQIIKYNLNNIEKYGQKRNNSVFNHALKQVSSQPECIEPCNIESK